MYLRIQLVFASIILFPVFLFSNPSICTALNDKLAASDSTSSKKEIPKWDIKKGDLTLAVNDLLPENYISEVEKEKGIPKIITTSYNENKILVEVKVNNQTWMKVALIKDSKNEKTVIIDELRLEDPLAEKPTGHLNQEQTKKGLPLPVFTHAKNQVFEICKSGGFEWAISNGQQHFGVMMLYKRMVGMTPSTPESTELLNNLERLYLFARKGLPENLKIKDLDHFVSLTGSHNMSPSSIPYDRNKIINAFNETGKLPSDVTIINDKNGIPSAIVFPEESRTKERLVFIAKYNNKLRAINWRDISHSHILELGKKLN